MFCDYFLDYLIRFAVSEETGLRKEYPILDQLAAHLEVLLVLSWMISKMTLGMMS